MRMLARAVAAVTGAVLLSALAGCGSSTGGTATTSSPEGASITVSDGWVKAADSGMTSAFAVLENHGDDPVTVVSARSSSAASVELHTTVRDASGSSAMQVAEGGFTVPAGASLSLEPGGDHLMLMGLTGPIAPGDTVTVTLSLEDGTTYAFTALAKAYSGADETYEDGMSATPSPAPAG